MINVFQLQIGRATLDGNLRIVGKRKSSLDFIHNFLQIIQLNGIGRATPKMYLRNLTRFVEMLKNGIHFFQHTVDIAANNQITFGKRGVATTKETKLRTKRNMYIHRNAFGLVVVRFHERIDIFLVVESGVKARCGRIACIARSRLIIFV